MHLSALAVTDFRNWPAAELWLVTGPTVLVGANGQGKTNLVEAVYYLATLCSHRSPIDAPLVRSGAPRAVIRGVVVSDARELRIEVEINPGRPNRAQLNGAPVARPREILGGLRAVLFAPEDLAIVRGDPSERRRFLDELLVARVPRLAAVRADYERVLKQRGALLKSAGGLRHAGDLRTLDVWDGHLARTGAELLTARLAALTALRPHAVAAYAQVAPAAPPLTLEYVSSLRAGLPAAPTEPLLEAALLAELARVRLQELERGVNLVGPHRDDLALSLGGLPLRGYASHGEAWSTTVALRLACYELLCDEGPEPVLVLDDVFAELDVSRRDQLAAVAGKAEQAIITAAVWSDIPDQLQATRIDVRDGVLQRVP
jgi:DNA replication and repair protein RecF